MVKCWKHSGDREGGRSVGGASDSDHFPPKAFWISLSALLVTVALGLAGYLALTEPGPEAPRTVRLSAPDPTGVLFHQSAVVDQQNHRVTLSVTSAGNRTSVVLFDVKRGWICYRPADQNRCFLQTMEQSDHDHVGSLLSGSPHQLSASLMLRRLQYRAESFPAGTPSVASMAEFLSTPDPSSPPDCLGSFYRKLQQ